MSERTHVSRRPCSLFKYAQLRSLNNISYILWSISNNALKTKGRPSIQHDTFYLPFWLGFVSVLHIYLLHLLSSRNKASLKFFVINLLKIICVNIYISLDMTTSSGTALHLWSIHPSLIHLLLLHLHLHLLLLQYLHIHFLLLRLKCFSLHLPPPPPASPMPPQIMSFLNWFYPFIHRTQASAYYCQLSWPSSWLLGSSSFCFCLDITTTWLWLYIIICSPSLYVLSYTLCW